MSAAFTGLAIGTGFERKYGVLKRLGTTALPRSVLIAAKTLAILGLEIIQAVLVCGFGAALGWHPHGDPALGRRAARDRHRRLRRARPARGRHAARRGHPGRREPRLADPAVRRRHRDPAVEVPARSGRRCCSTCPRRRCRTGCTGCCRAAPQLPVAPVRHPAGLGRASRCRRRRAGSDGSDRVALDALRGMGRRAGRPARLRDRLGRRQRRDRGDRRRGAAVGLRPGLPDLARLPGRFAHARPARPRITRSSSSRTVS